MNLLPRQTLRRLSRLSHPIFPRFLTTSPPPPPPPPPPQSSTTPSPIPPSTSATSLAHYLGYAGALPFLLGGTATILTQHPILAQSTQLYAATILSFLGGVHWGTALNTPSNRDFLYAVTPSVYAWSAALLHPPEGLPILAGGFAACWMYDENRFRGAAFGWYRKLRRKLTVAAIGGCLGAWWGIKGIREGRECVREKGEPGVVSTSMTEEVA